MDTTPEAALPELGPALLFLERGWLSSNLTLLLDADGATLVDTGYHCHATQMQQLVRHSLGERPLTCIVNTHVHSDHCGGNARLQRTWPQVQTVIPAGSWAAVQAWDTDALSYRPTGQHCPRFRADAVLHPGSRLHAGGRDWQVHAAPGHEPHALLLFAPDDGLLIAGDALWANGFGVVFPEIEGKQAFAEVAATLDTIEALQPRCVLPGHGPRFTDVAGALRTARQRLAGFVADPVKHARYAAKVLLKYKLLEWQRRPLPEVQAWCGNTPYLCLLRQRYFAALSPAAWVDDLVQRLVDSGAAALEAQGAQQVLVNR